MVRPWWYKKHWHRKKEHSYRSPNSYKPSSPPSGKLTLYYCPLCNVKSLFWNYHDKKYECLNPDCKAEGPSPDRLVRPSWYKQSRRKFSWDRKSLLHMLRKPRSVIRQTWNNIPIGLRKLFLSLLAIIGLVVVVRTGYILFTHQITTVTRDTIIFLVEIGFWIWIISILRSYKYKRRKPSFKLVFFSLLGIALVCAFAGIEPLTFYKDRTVSFVAGSWQTIMAHSQPPTPAPTEPTPAPVKPVPTPVPQPVEPSLLELEEETFRLINVERNRAGVPSTKWDAELYKLSKAHTQEMANRGEMFHTPMGAPYGENCWGGKGYYHYNKQELPAAIVDNWMSSPLHRAWLLHRPLRTSVVSIVETPDSQFASWTFWMAEAQGGPELVKRIYDEWQRDCGGSIPWIEWLKMKGYL